MVAILPLMSAIGGVASGAAGLMGAFKQDPMAGYAAQQIATNRAIANLMIRQAYANRFDPRGNLSYFTGSSFKHDLTPMTEALINAKDREDYARLTEDAPLAREALQRGARISRRFTPEAERATNEFFNAPRTDPRVYAARASTEARRATNAGFDDTANAVGRLFARTGASSSAPRALADLGRARAEDSRTSAVDAFMRGQQTGEQLRSSEENRLGERASTGLGFVTGIPNISDSTSAADAFMQQFASQLPGQVAGSLRDASRANLQGANLSRAMIGQTGPNWDAIGKGLFNTSAGVGAFLGALGKDSAQETARRSTAPSWWHQVWG